MFFWILVVSMHKHGQSLFLTDYIYYTFHRLRACLITMKINYQQKNFWYFGSGSGPHVVARLARESEAKKCFNFLFPLLHYGFLVRVITQKWVKLQDISHQWKRRDGGFKYVLLLFSFHTLLLNFHIGITAPNKKKRIDIWKYIKGPPQLIGEVRLFYEMGEGVRKLNFVVNVRYKILMSHRLRQMLKGLFSIEVAPKLIQPKTHFYI